MRGQSSISESSAPYHIGIDLMGSDTPPQELLRAVVDFVHQVRPSYSLTLFATQQVFEEGISPSPQILFHTVEEIISMDEPPLAAIRSKKNSSLCTGIRLLKEGALQAFISSGNTGALIGAAKLQLPTIAHVKRPALLTLLPTKNKDLAVLDVGANTHCDAQLLVQHAKMGVAYQKSRGIALPKLGLLNIGSEACKGTPELQEAYNQLNSLDPALFQFMGNIEGRDAFHGDLDVLVTDGFTGNVFLKTAEGIAAAILEYFEIEGEKQKSLEMDRFLSGVRKRLNYAEYPGAILCGVEGIVIKCHGSVSSNSLTRSIAIASQLIEHTFIDQMKNALFCGKTS